MAEIAMVAGMAGAGTVSAVAGTASALRSQWIPNSY